MLLIEWGQLHFDIKTLLPIFSSIVILLTDLYRYLTQYQVYDCVAFIFTVSRITQYSYNFCESVPQKKQRKGQD